MNLERKVIHFIGIAGAGMSALAELALREGAQVSGSDLRLGHTTERLRAAGALLYQGHDPSQVPPSPDLVVFSSAVPPENVELEEARAEGYRVVRRGEFLGVLSGSRRTLAVAGSHGKTSTASLLGHLLFANDYDPTILVGARLRAFDSGAVVGASNYLVVESDESDKSLLCLDPTIAILTNIDGEHLAAYGSLDDLSETFRLFLAKVESQEGFAVVCVDNARSAQVAASLAGRVLTYGLTAGQLRATNLEPSYGGMRFHVRREGVLLGECWIPLPGQHFVLNSLAAIACALAEGISFPSVVKALASFPGVDRRCEILSTAGEITYLTDYAHHPTEIRVTLRAIREAECAANGRLCVAFQPHRYSRTRDCYEEFRTAFEDADLVWVTPTYSAGEGAILGYGAQELAESLVSPQDVRYLDSLGSLQRGFIQELKPGDCVVMMGAGSIDGFARSFVRSHAGRFAEKVA